MKCKMGSIFSFLSIFNSGNWSVWPRLVTKFNFCSWKKRLKHAACFCVHRQFLWTWGLLLILLGIGVWATSKMLNSIKPCITTILVGYAIFLFFFSNKNHRWCLFLPPICVFLLIKCGQGLARKLSLPHMMQRVMESCTWGEAKTCSHAQKCA